MGVGVVTQYVTVDAVVSDSVAVGAGRLFLLVWCGVVCVACCFCWCCCGDVAFVLWLPSPGQISPVFFRYIYKTFSLGNRFLHRHACFPYKKRFICAEYLSSLLPRARGSMA